MKYISPKDTRIKKLLELNHESMKVIVSASTGHCGFKNHLGLNFLMRLKVSMFRRGSDKLSIEED